MRIFNAFQIVGAFVGWPFFIQWIASQTFPGREPAILIAGVMYIVAFFVMVSMVASFMHDDSKDSSRRFFF